MKTNIKQVTFVIIGLAIISIIFLISRSTFVHAAKKEGTKFGDWVVTCLPQDKDKSNENAPQNCFLTQQITAEKDEKPQILAVYQIGYGQDKVLRMIQIVPLGVLLEAGTSIVSSKNLIASGKFTACTQTGCQALAIISAEDLRKILINSDNAVAFMNIEGKQVNLPLSNKGLQSGLEYLK